MKKILVVTSLLSLFVTACSQDEYADLRKMTVQDYLDNRPLMESVLDKCANAEIKDKEICEVAKKAVNNIHDIF